MFKNLDKLIAASPSSRWVKIYQVYDGAGVVVAKVTAKEAHEKYTGLQYQFAELHEVAA